MTEQSRDAVIAEQLYLVVYQHTVEKSDYLQPDGYRQMLPDAVTMAAVISVISGILGAISHGFLAKVGGMAAEKAGALMGTLRSKDPKPEQLVVVMREMVPVLRSSETKWDEVAAFVALELTRRGMPFSVSQELARRVVSDSQRLIAD